jgi:alpha-tubulin suppressor-like RCC1 family protein
VTQKVPKQVLGPLAGKVVVFISAGYRHSAAVTDDGSLYTWGEGDFGRLGHGDSQSRFLPTRVKVSFYVQEANARTLSNSTLFLNELILVQYIMNFFIKARYKFFRISAV